MDLARGLALLGILVNHLVPGTARLLVWDVPAVLFALLVGVGAELGRGRGATWRAAGVRVAVLAVVGLSLADLGTRAAIVLVSLVVVTLAATWGARQRSRDVVVAAVLLLALAPPLALVVRQRLGPPWGPDVGWSDLPDPVRALATLLCATSYPALVWSALGLVGVLVARHLVSPPHGPAPGRTAATGLTLALGGRVLGIVALVLVGRTGALALEAAAVRERSRPPDVPERLALLGPYVPSAPSLLVSTGAALLVLGACLALCHRAAASPLVQAGAELGSMTLSAYTLHVLLLPGTERLLRAWPGLVGWPTYALHVAVLATALLAWRHLLPPPLSSGPLEWATRALIRRSGPSPARPPAPRRG